MELPSAAGVRHSARNTEGNRGAPGWAAQPSGDRAFVDKTSAFSTDYATARARFRTAVLELGWALSAYPLEAKGPDGEALTCGYKDTNAGGGKLNSISTSLPSVPPYLSSVTYGHPNGHPTSLALPSGYSTTYSFDGLYRLSSLTTQVGPHLGTPVLDGILVALGRRVMGIWGVHRSSFRSRPTWSLW